MMKHNFMPITIKNNIINNNGNKHKLTSYVLKIILYKLTIKLKVIRAHACYHVNDVYG